MNSLAEIMKQYVDQHDLHELEGSNKPRLKGYGFIAVVRETTGSRLFINLGSLF